MHVSRHGDNRCRRHWHSCWIVLFINSALRCCLFGGVKRLLEEQQRGCITAVVCDLPDIESAVQGVDMLSIYVNALAILTDAFVIHNVA